MTNSTSDNPETLPLPRARVTVAVQWPIWNPVSDPALPTRAGVDYGTGRRDRRSRSVSDQEFTWARAAREKRQVGQTATVCPRRLLSSGRGDHSVAVKS